MELDLPDLKHRRQGRIRQLPKEKREPKPWNGIVEKCPPDPRLKLSNPTGSLSGEVTHSSFSVGNGKYLAVPRSRKGD